MPLPYYGFLVFALFLSVPVSSTVFRVDEWDYLHEWQHLTLAQYLFHPNTAGQVNPLNKAIYALFVVPAGSNLALALFNFLIGATSLILWLLVLRTLHCLNLTSVLMISLIRLSYVGIADVFLFPLQGALEVAFAFFTFALLLILHNRLAGAALSLFLAASSWANGFLVSFTTPIAFALTRGFSRCLYAISLPAIVALTSLVLIPRPSESSPPVAFSSTLHYFAASAVLNGSLGGLAPLLFPGVIHLAFFLFLFAAATYVLFTDESLDRRFIILVLLSSQVAVSLILALTRSHHGVAHAGSYRYVYMTVFFQLPLLAIVLASITERYQRWNFGPLFVSITLLLYGVATVEAVRARQIFAVWEQERATCLRQILSNSSDTCILTIYHRNDAEFIRNVWRTRFAPS